MTALYTATEDSHEKFVKVLLETLECGAKSAKVDGNNTPLHWDAIKTILKFGAHINSRDEKGYTALHLATEAGHKEVVELLLDCGAKVDSKDDCDRTPLHLGSKRGYREIIETILKYDADINSRDDEDRTALYYATEGGHKEVVKVLLESGARVDFEDDCDMTPLHLGAITGYREIIETILKFEVDINSRDEDGRGKTALHYAAEVGHKEIVKLLLESGAEVDLQDNDDNTPLHLGAQFGCQDIVKTILKFGADINSTEENGRTALHYATEGGHKEVVKVLLECGAKVDSRDIICGTTPLHMGADYGYWKIIKTILKFGADINSRDDEDRTPLDIASERGHHNIIEFFLKLGAKTNTKEALFGRTALHVASQEGHAKVVGTLLKYGYDINATCSDGSTPFDYASEACSQLYSPPCQLNDDNPDSGECWCQVTVKVLIRHVVKMKAANLYVSEQYLRSINHRKFRDFQYVCEEELARMKSEVINNTNISCYDILSKGTRSLAIYLRNEILVQDLKLDVYKTKFPIYASILESNFRMGMVRKKLLERANKVFHFHFNNFSQLPHECSEQIFSYLSDRDLKALSDACRPLLSSISGPIFDIVLENME